MTNLLMSLIANPSADFCSSSILMGSEAEPLSTSFMLFSRMVSSSFPGLIFLSSLWLLAWASMNMSHFSEEDTSPGKNATPFDVAHCWEAANQVVAKLLIWPRHEQCEKGDQAYVSVLSYSLDGGFLLSSEKARLPANAASAS